MNYVAYESNGRVTQSGTCQDGALEFQGAPGTLKLAVENYVDPNGFYVSGGTLVQIPPKPSANHAFNYASKQWEDPRTLDDLKGEKWRNIKANRDSHEYGGFTWDGSVFDSDATSQQRIAGALQLAQLSTTFIIDWTLADNSIRTLDAQEMGYVALALGSHVSEVFSHAQELRAQIEETSSIEQLETIHW